MAEKSWEEFEETAELRKENGRLAEQLVMANQAISRIQNQVNQWERRFDKLLAVLDRYGD